MIIPDSWDQAEWAAHMTMLRCCNGGFVCPQYSCSGNPGNTEDCHGLHLEDHCDDEECEHEVAVHIVLDLGLSTNPDDHDTGDCKDAGHFEDLLGAAGTTTVPH